MVDLNLHAVQDLKDQFAFIKALNAAAPNGWTIETLREHLLELLRIEREHLLDKLAEADTRYQQRFQAQGEALNAAFLSQQMATQTALTAAEKAVGAALTAAEKAVGAALTATDRAVIKAETAADKRFDCVASETPILCADLIWRPAGLLHPGDELIAFDETALTRRGRRYRRAVVTSNARAEDTLLLVRTSHGDVRCNGNHPWLVRGAHRSAWHWVETRHLQEQDVIMHPLDLWEVEHSWEAGWLAGMYDGEGCLSFGKGRVQLTISQRESATSARIEQALKQRVEKVYAYRVEPGRWGHKQPFYHFLLGIRPDILKILGSVRPPRLLVMAEKAWIGQVVASHGRTATILAIEESGTGEIARLSTSTQTYIAAGFAMHNSVNEFRGALSDQAKNQMTRGEVMQAHQNLLDKIESLMTRVTTIEGRTLGLAAAQVTQYGAQSMQHGVFQNATILVGVVLATLMSMGALVVSILRATH